MTTIAWDGTVLIGDTFADRGGLKHRVDAKVWRLKDGRLYGGSGSYGEVLAVRDWLDGGEKPSISDYSGILITDGRAEIIDDKLNMTPSPWPYFALGSGRDFAIASMRCGKTAREAIEIAAEHDTYTWPPFVEVSA